MEGEAPLNSGSEICIPTRYYFLGSLVVLKEKIALNLCLMNLKSF